MYTPCAARTAAWGARLGSAEKLCLMQVPLSHCRTVGPQDESDRLMQQVWRGMSSQGRVPAFLSSAPQGLILLGKRPQDGRSILNRLKRLFRENKCFSFFLKMTVKAKE